ncbi:MAG: ATP-binding protein [Deltaproteobacteria bacterium]|nr:ATP-binding protein [Deltaproteobacteria bacterium]
MFTRSTALPSRTFFLFGPRGTGKTTWLRTTLPRAKWFDLVLDRELVRLMRAPEVFRQEVEALPRGSWVVVDEVQRLPSVLNDVQDLIARHASRYRFALTGSSARRLRRAPANLLPGRAINRSFFPLTAQELRFAFSTEDLLRFGCLPAVRTERSAEGRIDLLEAYVANYLAQEVRAEATVKGLEPFVRFLEVAALANGQVTNVAGIARDAAVARQTVLGYFEALVDTLLGVWLPAWKPRAKIKEVGHPKFFLFDPGVVRALAGRVREPLDAEERGRLLETLVLHELRARIDMAGCGGRLNYWRTPSGSEVDFVWSRGATSVAVEAKASRRWRPEDGRAMRDLAAATGITRCFGVYLGDLELRDGPIVVLPFVEFTRRLAAGKVLRR